MPVEALRREAALFSVYDRTGVVELARDLAATGMPIYATGGTRQHLLANGVEALDVGELTGFPSLFDGRVKTLHPRVFGAILADRENPAGKAPWRQWGPYLSERQWATVREDYSADGDAWNYFPHDHARSRAYRWGEDGLAGFSDDRARLCFALALWNHRDPFLKERLFGVTGPEGNHGEDVKEVYYYLDATPTHSYMRMLYKYPQREYPYEALVAESRRRTRLDGEYELLDTGIFDEDRYFDVFVEYAKGAPDDILCQVTIHNRRPRSGPDRRAACSSGFATPGRGTRTRPRGRASSATGPGLVEAAHIELGTPLLAN